MRLSTVLCMSLMLLTGCIESPSPAETDLAVSISRVLPRVPPTIKAGPPELYNSVSQEEYIERTKPDRRLIWFRTVDGGWHIDWDAERAPFRKIVIHHSATDAQATPKNIDKLQYDRLYVGRYNSKDDEPYVKGLVPHSGHTINNEEAFTGYHHLIYQDGKIVTTLSPLLKKQRVQYGAKEDGTYETIIPLDEFPQKHLREDQTFIRKVGSPLYYVDMVGWHSGKWEVNCESIAICLVGEFSTHEPTDAQLNALAGVIGYYRVINPAVTVHPHNEFKPTECPGKSWDSWRKKLAALAGLPQ